MKELVTIIATLVCLFANASPYITNVVAKQHYPWSGEVDISFEVIGNLADGVPEGKVSELSVEMIDEVTGKKYSAMNLTGDIDSSEGIHNVIWDMTGQGISIYAPKAIFSISYLAVYPRYRVIDISAGSEAEQYPLSVLTAVPEEGWGLEYKTDKIVLRRIDGTNGVYYAGVFEITEAQWDKVMGGTSTSAKPKADVSYEKIRGEIHTYCWWRNPEAVDATKFMGRLRQKTGLMTLDLPTEAEWMFAARAGVTTKWLCGDSETGLEEYAWNTKNSAGEIHEVGSLSPNVWGLYDVHGNVSEWCLNYQEYDDHRVMHGGAYNASAKECAFDYQKTANSFSTTWGSGFRLFCRPVSD